MPEENKEKTIMVVDDEPDMKVSLQMTLTRAGFDVVLAESGHDSMNDP